MHQHPLGFALDDPLAQDANRFEGRPRTRGLRSTDAVPVADYLVRCGIQRAAVDGLAKPWGCSGSDCNFGNNLAVGTDGAQFIRNNRMNYRRSWGDL